MVEVIGKSKAVARKITCSGCGNKLAYYKNDVRSWVHHDYGGGSDTYYCITCPGCNKDVSVEVWY